MMRPEIYKKERKIKGSASLTLYEFINDFQNAFCARVKKYITYHIEDDNIEHIFYYGEQRTKTLITAALDEICDSYFMQEPAIERKHTNRKGKALKLKGGRVDYWFRFGNKTKFSALLEIKQAWIRYYNKEEWTIRKEGIDAHKSAVQQLKKINDKMYYKIDNLYGLALTILPLFVHYNKGEKQISLKSETLSEIAKDALKLSKADACGWWVIPRKLCPMDSWEDVIENHPGIVFLWSISKYTRK